jgi:hypothetical protein
VPSGKVLFLATVYTHLAAFHVPFMKMLQGWGCEVHAAASSAEGHKERVEEAGVICWEIPICPFPLQPGQSGGLPVFEGFIAGAPL